VTTLYWVRYLFLVILLAGGLWIVWQATADARVERNRRS
jgi:hypothetical protein